MKIRMGFVSNSSSSSFVCDVCGAEVSGMDLSLSEALMYQCEHGHLFCYDHAKGNFSDASVEALIQEMTSQELKDYLISINSSEYRKETREKIEAMTLDEVMVAANEEEFDDDLNDALYEGIPEKFCPICAFEESCTADTLAYMAMKNDQTIKQILTEMKKRFGNWDSFKTQRDSWKSSKE